MCPYSCILAHKVEEAEDEGLRPSGSPSSSDRLGPRYPSRAASTSATTGATTPTDSPSATGSRSTFLPTSPAPRSPWHSIAEEQGRGRAYRSAAYHAFFVAGQNLGDEGVLREVARSAGLDEGVAEVAAWDPARISALCSVREAALSIRVHGVPTVATREEVLYYGAASPGKARALLAGR